MNPISLCLIVRHDPHLAATVASARPYVREICIFCDSPDDEEAKEAERLANRFERSFALNNAKGKLSDWGAARNRAHALATMPWHLTLDSDDILEHGERLEDVLRKYDTDGPVRLSLPYDYSFDPMTGRCTRRQPRVRLVKHPEAFEWRGAAHEGWYTKPGVECRDVYDLSVTVTHTKTDWTDARARALEIIADYPDEHGEIADPRQRYDYGMAQAAEGERDAAVRELVKYIETSGRGDEKAQAACKLAELTGGLYDLITPMQWAHAAHEFAPDAFEPLYKLAQIRLLQALTVPPNDVDPAGARQVLAQSAVDHCRKAIATPLDSLVPYSPQDREVGVYEVWAEAARLLGEKESELDAIMLPQGAPELRLRLREAYPQSRQCGCDIVFVCGNAAWPWNPVSVERSGIGGSELAVIHMAKGLAAKGHRVRVYVDCGREGLYDGVEYLAPVRLNEEQAECDLLVAWRSAAYLEALPARRKWLWLHDTQAAAATQYLFAVADRVLVLSEWHREHVLTKAHPKALPAAKVYVTRNGIDDFFFEAATERRDPHVAIYASSADRGLETLLAPLWSRVRWQVPDARLLVFYGDTALMSAFPQRAMRLRADLEDLRGCGVENRGRVSQRELAKAMRGAGCLLYSTRFTETSCQVSMQAMATGLRIVTSHLAALPETVGPHGVLLPGDAATPEYQSAFVDAAVKAMTSGEDDDRERAQASARERFGWGPVVEQWNTWLTSDLAEQEAAE